MKAKIYVGADPEFELTRRGAWEDDPVTEFERCFSVEYFERMQESYDGSGNRTIGVDGAGEAVELRPHYAIDGRWLVYNTKRLFKRFAKRFKKYGLSVQGNNTPLGAHIHFGIALHGKTCLPYTPSGALLHMFDYAIGKYLMERSGKARDEYEYKALSSARSNDHGFEYRTPSAITFAKPAYVELTCRLLKAVLEFYLKNPYKLQYKDEEELEKAVDRIKERVLTAKDHRTLRDLDHYHPSLRDNVVKYWLTQEV